jgi:hypothetical protein
VREILLSFCGGFLAIPESMMDVLAPERPIKGGELIVMRTNMLGCQVHRFGAHGSGKVAETQP